MHSFYFPDRINKINILSEEESGHAIRVLRLKLDDVILLLDGKGKGLEAKIIDAHPKKCTVQLNGHEISELPAKAKLHIAIAPTKNIDRFEWFVEKATEIGIDEITPILSSQSERKILNLERTNKILVSAMKQSQRLFIPKLNPLTPYDAFLENAASSNCQKFIAHCNEDLKENFSNKLNTNLDTIILIGPEGDFNQMEVKTAIVNSFIPVSFGNARLRTETAGVFAASVYNA